MEPDNNRKTLGLNWSEQIRSLIEDLEGGYRIWTPSPAVSVRVGLEFEGRNKFYIVCCSSWKEPKYFNNANDAVWEFLKCIGGQSFIIIE